MPWLLDLQFRIEENIHNETSDVPGRVSQIALQGMGRISLPNGGDRKLCYGEFFYWVVGIWGVISIILTFVKDKKQHSVYTEHQLKSKLAWPVCIKSMEVKLKMVQDQWLQQKWSSYWVIT